jgi:MFS family permease
MTPTAPADRAILATLFVGVLMAALDIAIVGPALPALRREFGQDERAIAWVFTIYVLFNLLGTPIMAKLSDRLGRRLVYVADVVLFAIGSGMVAGASSFGMLLAGRAVQAFGAGGIFPVASATIGDVIPAEKRGAALGLIGAVFGIAFLLGPLVAAALLGVNWRWLFIINLPVAAVLIVASARLLPTRAAGASGPFDWAGTTLLALGLAALTVALSRLDPAALALGEGSPPLWSLFAVAVAAVIGLIAVERRAADPLLRPGWFASPQVRLVALFAAGAGLGEAALVFIPDLAVRGLGITAQRSSYVVLPIVIAAAIGAPVLGRLLDRVGSRPIVIAALLCLGTGGLGIGLAPTTLATLVVGGVFLGLGLAGLLGAPLRYILLAEIPAAERAAAQGLLTVFISLGQLVSGALIGAIASSHGGGSQGYRVAFVSTGAVVLAMVVFALGLRGRPAMAGMR